MPWNIPADFRVITRQTWNWVALLTKFVLYNILWSHALSVVAEFYHAIPCTDRVSVPFWSNHMVCMSYVFLIRIYTLIITIQPRPQGFSLKKWVGRGAFLKGKALGTMLIIIIIIIIILIVVVSSLLLFIIHYYFFVIPCSSSYHLHAILTILFFNAAFGFFFCCKTCVSFSVSFLRTWQRHSSS